jgi:TonB-linked SusC/RagA family outer membrane protein
MRKIALLFAVLLCSTVAVFAQVTIKGKVTDVKDGAPLSGASVKVKGSRAGVSTNADGSFSIDIPKADAVLETSLVGYTAQNVTVNASSGALAIKLAQDTKGLTEVVVTAFGIKREKKALGYAVSTVSKKDLELRPEGDIGRVLTGKAAGVTITNSSGLSGSGTNIIVRAIGTITGDATPLFVVDGVPFNGGTNANAGFTYGNQTSSRFLDLDPNNIENVSILKGLSATTLYGEFGRNGVILITTKNGGGVRAPKKTEITVSQSYFSTTVANLPEYNTKYGGGFDLSNGVTFFSNWGGPFSDPAVLVNHPYSRAALNSAFPEYIGAKYAYKAYPNSVKDFFRTGNVSTTSVNIGGANGTSTYNANFSYLNDVGFTVGNELKKLSFGIGGSSKLSNNFTVSGTFNYVVTGVKAPPTSTSFGSRATNISVFGDVLYTPTSVDLSGLPWENPLDRSHVYYRSANDIQNPRWTTKNAFTQDNVNRTFGNLQLKYDFKKGLSLSYRVGFDNYSEDQLYAQNRGGAGSTSDGLMRTSNGKNTIYDQNLFLNYLTDLSSNWKLGLDAGINVRNDIFKQTGILSTQQLVFGLLNHNNFVNHLSTSEDGTNLDFKSETQTIGAYLQGVLSYNDYLYFTVGGRQGWSSTLEKANRGILYPSGSVSFIPTTAITALKDNKYINYLKIRAGYATSAEFPGAYATRPSLGIATKVFVDNAATSINTNSISNRLPNADLKPALIREIEAGVEGKFIDNRLNLDVTFYKRIAKDQLLDQDLDPSSGYTVKTINAGTVTNKGVELGLGYTVVRNKNWKWQVDGLYAKNVSKVSDLPADLKEIRTAGYTNLGNFAINGEPLGVIKGLAYSKTADGQKIVGTDGNYVTANEISILGDPNPDYKLTGISTLTYKQFSFRFQMEYTKGGDMYSATSSVLLGRGVTRDTEFDRALPYILPGVKADKTPNDIQISATQAYFNNSVAGGAADESGIYDASNVRIREASLSYSLPQNLLKKLPIGSLSFTISGSNLWYFAPNFPKYVHFDPETSGLGVSNGRGLEFFTGPSARRVGASLRVTF